MRHKIIGTLVWLAAAVIVLPFFMDGDGLEELTKQAQQAEQPVKLAVKPIVIKQPDVDAAIAVTKPAPAPAPTVADTSAKQPTAKPKPQPVSPNKPSLDKHGLPQSWVVQLASFKQQANAKALRDKLIKAKYPAYLQASGSNHRVLVGPVNTRKEAEQMQAKLKTAYKLSGIVVTYKVDQ